MDQGDALDSPDGRTTSEATTRRVRVYVEAEYSPEHSSPMNNHWFFLYTVQISNEGDETVQLISRHWVIADAMDRVEEVRGLGVVGKQPVLEPGDSFEYTSGCPLGTPFGEMRGTYQMVTASGDRFDVEIAPFALKAPFTVH
ncbi:MAG: Co2+/Mg2+ efflux protein ApaG [Vicinamibacterales bacterium]